MNRIKLTGKRMVCFSILGLLTFGFAVWGLFFYEPTQLRVKAREEVVFKITAAQVFDMYGYQFEFHYDKMDFEYNGMITSSLSEISTIFAKEFDSYLLVGATKIGKEEGLSGKRTEVCEITLTAKKDCDLSNISIDSVNIVQSDLTYLEGTADWTYSLE